jgi:hypothetical protein
MSGTTLSESQASVSVHSSASRPSAQRAAARITYLLVLLVALSAFLAPAASASHNAIEKVSAGPAGGNGNFFGAAIAGGQISDAIQPGMSEDGERLYFTTYEQMTADDTDDAADIYQREDGVTTLVSDDASAAPDANLDVTYSGVSKDGTSVFFTTDEQLSPDSGSSDGDGASDLYVRDGGELKLVSIGGGSAPAFGGASANGEYVAFETSEALTGDDTDGNVDVYGRNLSSETFERISVGDTSASGNLAIFSSYSGMSRDGSHVFFTTYDQILSEDTDFSMDVYERLPGSATTNRVSGGPGGTGNGAFNATFEWQSADGAHVFFTTAESLAATDTDSSIDIYDRSGGATTHVSQGIINGNGAFPSFFGRSSEDGTLVFFTTKENLGGDIDGASDIYRRNLTTSTTAKISIGNGNFPAKLGGEAKCGGFPSPFPPCTDPAPGSAARALQFDVSADGQHVFFETDENLNVPGTFDGNGTSDVYERVGTAPVRLVSVSELSNTAGGYSYFAGAAADGSRAYFGTPAGLAANDQEGRIDGYQRVGGVTLLATIGALNDGVPDNGNFDVSITHATLSRDGTRGYFQTVEPLTADDTDTSEDVYFTETTDAVSEDVSAGGSASTGTAPTSTDPLETDVTPPGGGAVTIEETAPSQSAPTGYSLLGYQSTITANPNTPPTDTNPIVLKFRIDSSLLPDGYDGSAPGCGQTPSQCVQVFRNGAQVEDPCPTSGTANPSPCIDSRGQPGGPGTDIEITVLTLSASDWNFGLPNGKLVVVKDVVPDDPQDFDFTSDGGLSPPSFSLDVDSDNTLSDTRTFDDLPPGDHYSVTESVPAGWQQDSATCSDSSPVSNIDISAGETVTCTFTNSQLGYPRPESATPVRVSLVPAYDECTDPNRVHGPPDFPGNGADPDGSCNPPAQSSGNLTVGTADANGADPRSVGSVRLRAIVGDPGGSDGSDVGVAVQVTDVRCQAGVLTCGPANAVAGDDYTGDVQVRVGARITDHNNDVSPGGGTDRATGDKTLEVTVPCGATSTPDTIGSTCAITTTADAVYGDPSAAKEGTRAVWQLGQVHVFDGGADGDVDTPAGNTLFANQGVFVP